MQNISDCCKCLFTIGFAPMINAFHGNNPFYRCSLSVPPFVSIYCCCCYCIAICMRLCAVSKLLLLLSQCAFSCVKCWHFHDSGSYWKACSEMETKIKLIQLIASSSLPSPPMRSTVFSTKFYSLNATQSQCIAMRFSAWSIFIHSSLYP